MNNGSKISKVSSIRCIWSWVWMQRHQKGFIYEVILSFQPWKALASRISWTPLLDCRHQIEAITSLKMWNRNWLNESLKSHLIGVTPPEWVLSCIILSFTGNPAKTTSSKMSSDYLLTSALLSAPMRWPGKWEAGQCFWGSSCQCNKIYIYRNRQGKSGHNTDV